GSIIRLDDGFADLGVERTMPGSLVGFGNNDIGTQGRRTEEFAAHPPGSAAEADRNNFSFTRR
ncbi:MAG TPA: hypothetical protein VF398_03790, partial [bacterium]